MKVTESSDHWGVSRSDSEKPRGAPSSDNYRRIEGDRQRPPSKEKQEQAVAEGDKKPRSVFDLKKQEKPKAKTSSDKGPSAAKGKQATGKGRASTDESSLEGTQRRSTPKKNGDQELDFFADAEAGTEMEEELPQAPVEEAGELPQTEETPPAEQPQQFQETGAERPRIKQPVEMQTPLQAAAQLSAKKGVKTAAAEPKKEGEVSKKDKTKGEARPSAAEGGEKGVAAAMQSPIQAAAFHSEKASAGGEASRSATIRDLAAQIVDRIQVMRKDDQTSTIITLRHPPILSGATITLTASDHAKREFNISFANLSPDAKVFLDRKLKEDSLTETLDRKGIVVHNLTTTTEPEKVITADAGQASKDRQDQQQEQQQQQKRQQFAGTEEEEVT